MRYSMMIALALTPVGAVHADFDPVTGGVHSDAAAYAYGFDVPPGDGIVAFDVDGERLGARQLEGRFDGEGIEGRGALLIGGRIQTVHLDARPWPAALDGRRVELRLWVRDEGSRATAQLWWASGDGWSNLVDDRGNPLYIGSLTLSPSGRATDDGWRELTSGPFDFALGGRLRPDHLTLVDSQRDERDDANTIWGVADRDLRARVDALEIVDLGPGAVPDAACRLPDQEETCGPHGMCVFGRCVDAASIVGPLLPPVLREAMVERRAFELSTFNGSRVAEARWPALAERFAEAGAAESARALWGTLIDVYTESGDGHAVGPGASPLWATADVCVAPGVADRLPGAPAAPIVYRLGANAVDGLRVGDAITAVDGLPPSAWLALNNRRAPVNGDPASFEVQNTRTFVELAQVAGATLEVSRCVGAAACAPDAVETETIDFAALAAPIWDDAAPYRRPTTLCDYRVEDLDLWGTDGVASYDRDGVRVLTINGVPGDEPFWWSRVESVLTDAPPLLVIDQRLGYGGQITAVELILGYVLGDAVAQYLMLPSTTGWGAFEARERYVACLEARDYVYDATACGSAEGGRVTGADGQVAPTRVAVLGGSVVSGNEFLLRLLGARAEVRTFAPAPTTGGFGWVQDMPPLVGEWAGGRMQLVDTQFAPGDGRFATGQGLAPDDEVRLRQSDVLLGLDTTLEAAMRWLLTEEAQ